MLSVYFKEGVFDDLISYDFDGRHHFSKYATDTFVYIKDKKSWIPFTSITKWICTEKRDPFISHSYSKTQKLLVELITGGPIEVSAAERRFLDQGLEVTDLMTNTTMFIPNWNIKRIIED
jgi:hypothetical protein